MRLFKCIIHDDRVRVVSVISWLTTAVSWPDPTLWCNLGASTVLPQVHQSSSFTFNDVHNLERALTEHIASKFAQ